MSPFLRAVEGDPVEPRPPAPVALTVDGQRVDALPGQTVAAVLMASGRDSWRTTRRAERPRGVFCGIGACFDCLVIVNGTPDVRACQRTITPGDTITTQPGAVLPEAPPLTSEEMARRAFTSSDARRKEAAEVVVVGAGPAGIAAALAAGDAGVEVLLVDAGRTVGGQFHRQLPEEFRARRPERIQHGWAEFARDRDRLAGHSKIMHLSETSVWAIETLPEAEVDPGARAGVVGADAQVGGGVDGERIGRARYRLWLQSGPADGSGRRIRSVEVRAVVLAAGAVDRVLPFDGWELPGVYSAGAAQALAKGQRIAVGKRVLVAGTGPFLLPVAESLVSVGAEVVGLLEANALRTVVKGWLTDPLVARGKFAEGFGYAGMLVRRRIPFKYGQTVIAAHGNNRVEAVTTARLDVNWRPIPGSEREVEVDAVCLGFGFTAQLELAVSARCELGTGPDGGPTVIVDENQQTSTPGVFAAGELTGIGGATLAAAEGRVAGAAAAGVGGRLTSQLAKEQVAKGKRFAQALGKAYPVKGGWRSWSGGETLVCRCEEVTRAELERTLAERDVTGGRSLKLTSRVGLGLCQGRVCSRTVAELADSQETTAPGNAEVGSVEAGRGGGMRGFADGSAVRAQHGRPIAVPVRLGDLARKEEGL